jgi:serine/threonine protein kinase
VDLSRGVLLDDRYLLGDPLGQGGMATVYRAHDTMLGRDVAIKLFPAVGHEDEVARHRAEMRILAQLSHPGLVTLHDAGSADLGGPHAQTYLVMELVEGATLADRLSRGPLSPAHTARLGRQMAEALSVVHGAGIVHRDLKPANILLPGPEAGTGAEPDALTTGPVVKLADFGIARLSDDARLTATGTTLGTASYLSPEQAVGGAVGPPTDVYALGLVLLECLTGRRAFTGTVTEVAVARLNTSPRIPAELGPRWTAVLTAMTERAAEDRPAAADAALALGEIADLPLDQTVRLDVVRRPATADARTVTTELPSAVPPRPGTERRPAGPLPSATRFGRGRRRAVVAVASVLVLTSGALLASQLGRAPDAGAEPPSYPSVDGELGAALLELQQSVQP